MWTGKGITMETKPKFKVGDIIELINFKGQHYEILKIVKQGDTYIFDKETPFSMTQTFTQGPAYILNYVSELGQYPGRRCFEYLHHQDNYKLIRSSSKVNSQEYNSTCLRCGSPAFLGLTNRVCSKGCK